MRRSRPFSPVRIALVAAALAVGPVVVAPALAADCTEKYNPDQLVLDVAALEQAIVASDKDRSLSLAVGVQRNLPCAQQRLPLNFLARIYRALGGGYYVGGDTKTGERWFRTAIEIDETFRYGVEDLPADHPLRPAYASLLQAKESDPVPTAGKVFGPPGTWSLDGRRITTPAARPDRPHLLQREHEGTVETWLLDGATFPSQVLVAGKAVAEDKGSKKSRRARRDVPIQQLGQGAMVVDRSSPPEQVPLILTGAGLIAGGIGLYAGSVVSRQNFNTIRESEDRLRKSQQTTNRLVLGSLAAIAIGSGTLTYGIIIDHAGNPIGPRIDIRF